MSVVFVVPRAGVPRGPIPRTSNAPIAAPVATAGMRRHTIERADPEIAKTIHALQATWQDQAALERAHPPNAAARRRASGRALTAFMFLNASLFRPFPGIVDQDRLVILEFQRGCGWPGCSISSRTLEDLEDLRAGMKRYDALAYRDAHNVRSQTYAPAPPPTRPSAHGAGPGEGRLT